MVNNVSSLQLPDAPARLFAAAWSFAYLFHFIDDMLFTPARVAVLVAALALLVTGGTAWSWLAAACSHLWYHWDRLPDSSASEYTAAMFDGVVLVALVMVVAKKRALKVDRVTLYEQMRPMAAFLLVFVLMFAVLHKLNGEFFDLAVSWAPSLVRTLFDVFHLPDIALLETLSPAGTVGFELMLVVGLLFRPARSLTLVAVWVFWLLITIYGVPQYAVVMYALALSVLDPRILEGTARVLGFAVPRGDQARLHPAALFAWLFVFGCIFSHWFARAIAALVCFIVLGVVVGVVARRVRRPLAHDVIGRPTLASLVLFGALTASEMTPYLGFKDWPTLTMYANLRIDSCGNNHLFLPARTRHIEKRVVVPRSTWQALAEKLKKGREVWGWNYAYIMMEVTEAERTAWDLITFGEMVAAMARDAREDPDDVMVSYIRDDVVVTETVGALLRREGSHPFHRVFPFLPEQDAPCSERTRRSPFGLDEKSSL